MADIKAQSKKERRLARQRAEAEARRRRALRKRVGTVAAVTVALALAGGLVGLLISSGSGSKNAAGQPAGSGLVSNQNTAAGNGIRAVFTQPHLT